MKPRSPARSPAPSRSRCAARTSTAPASFMPADGLSSGINGDLTDHGLIANLPYGACVEVPCLVDRAGVHPCVIGLPATASGPEPEQHRGTGTCRQGAHGKRQGGGPQAMALHPLTAAVCWLEDMEVNGRHVHGHRALLAPVRSVGTGLSTTVSPVSPGQALVKMLRLALC